MLACTPIACDSSRRRQ